MSELVVPTDTYAEEVVVGCVVDCPDAACRAAGRLRPEDFYDPALRRLFVAGLAAEHEGVADLRAARVVWCAQRADVAEARVWELLDARPVMTDTSGSYARRVARAADARRLMRATEEAYRALGSGEDPAEVRARLMEVAA